MIRLLLVDDQPLIRAGLRMLCDAEADLTVVGEAENGAEAVALAASEAPDLIVMDIRMPEMNGLDAAARIRQSPKTGAIPILAATAKAMPGDREKCLASGCSGYIAKPFTHRELGAAIRGLLEGSGQA